MKPERIEELARLAVSNSYMDGPDECYPHAAETIRTAIREFADEAIELAEGHFIHGHSVAGPGFAKAGADRIRRLLDEVLGEEKRK